MNPGAEDPIRHYRGKIANASASMFVCKIFPPERLHGRRHLQQPTIDATKDAAVDFLD
jgi:hypothetical protein